MVHAFAPAFIAGSIDNDRGILGNPAKDRNFFKFFFSQGSDLCGNCQAHAWNVQVGGVVANINVGLAGMNVFFPEDFIGNAIQLAEGPGPKFQELITDRAVFLAEKERKQDARKIQDHEESEDKQDPGDIELTQYEA